MLTYLHSKCNNQIKYTGKKRSTYSDNLHYIFNRLRICKGLFTVKVIKSREKVRKNNKYLVFFSFVFFLLNVDDCKVLSLDSHTIVMCA